MKISPYPTPTDKCVPWTPDNLDSVKPQAIVTKIDLVIAEGPNGALQEVKLSPMTISDKAVFTGKMKCKHTQDDGKIIDVVLPVKVPAKTGSLWNGYFTVAHMAELEFEFDVLPADSSNLSGHPIFARYNSDQPSFSPGYGTWSEKTTFELVDKGPQ
jgi:hypothetical protein